MLKITHFFKKNLYPSVFSRVALIPDFFIGEYEYQFGQLITKTKYRYLFVVWFKIALQRMVYSLKRHMVRFLSESHAVSHSARVWTQAEVTLYGLILHRIGILGIGATLVFSSVNWVSSIKCSHCGVALKEHCTPEQINYKYFLKKLLITFIGIHMSKWPYL